MPPSWQEVKEVSRATIDWNLQSLLLFTNTQLAKLVLHFLLFLFIAGSLIRTIRRRRYQKEHAQELQREADALRAPDEAPPIPKPDSLYSLNHMSLQHPLASAVLITSVATIFIYEVLPTPAALLVLCAAIFAAAALHFRRDMSSSTTIALGATGLLLCLFLQLFSARLIAVDVWVMGLEGLLNLYLIFVIRKLERFRDQGWWQSCFRGATFVWLVASILGLLVWLAGFDHSSAILINGTSRQLLVTLAFIEAYSVLAGILRLSVDSQTLSQIRIIKNHGPLVLARTLLFCRVLLLVFWFKIASRAYTFSTALKEVWEEVIAKEVSLGSLSFSLGSILALLVGTVVAIYGARFIRFLLTEEALPRTKMRIGTRAAITTGAYALSLGLGFLAVLAAAGLELDKLTILVSAFGVGIGFGLQTIVQNFVSGVILIFGRPINVGDRVQIGELFGTVTMIGFRASTVKTYQGAEVIVPNSSFVTDQVINWSLTDDKRRIELDIGVAYGTEPRRVLEILTTLAKANDEIMPFPEPEAIFTAFGDSSLNFQLRCWVEEGSRWPNIKSDLSVALTDALAAADIEIPFPQRDLHLKSVEPDLEKLLQTTDSP